MSYLHTPSHIVNPLAHVRRFGFGSGVGGSSTPDLPAGATARWNVRASTGSDGDLLASVSDLIGSNTATASGSARPTLKTGANGLNGRPVMRFDGVANALSITQISAIGNFTIIGVMRRIGTNAVSLGQNGDFLPAHGRNATLALIGNGRGSVSGGYAEASSSTTGWEILSAAWSGNAAVRGQSNASTLTFGSVIVYGNSTDWNRIGRRGLTFGNNDLADLIYWPSVLTADQIVQAHAHLNATWGGVY